MSTDQGCPLRESCVAYQNPLSYTGSVASILRPGFESSCDSVTLGRLESNFCPLYDLNNQVVAGLKGVCDGLEGMMTRVRGATETRVPFLRGE